jgi:hypothetical protein
MSLGNLNARKTKQPYAIYKRACQPGGTYFLMVNLAERHRTLLADHVEHLGNTVRKVKQVHPFDILAWVVLPDYLPPFERFPQPTHWRMALPAGSWLKPSSHADIPPANGYESRGNAKTSGGCGRDGFGNMELPIRTICGGTWLSFISTPSSTDTSCKPWNDRTIQFIAIFAKAGYHRIGQQRLAQNCWLKGYDGALGLARLIPAYRAGHQSQLHLPQLETNQTPRQVWQGRQVLQAAADKLKRFDGEIIKVR